MLSWTLAASQVGLIYPTSFGSFTEGWLLNAREQPNTTYERVFVTPKDDLDNLTETLSMKPSPDNEFHYILQVSEKYYAGLVKSILKKGIYNPNSLLTVSCGDYFLYKELLDYRPMATKMKSFYLHSPLSLGDLQRFAEHRPDFALPRKYVVNLHKFYGQDLDLTWQGITLPPEVIQGLPDYSGESLRSVLGTPPPDIVRFTVALLSAKRGNAASFRKLYQQYVQLNLDPMQDYTCLRSIYITTREILSIKRILPENRHFSGKYACYLRQIGDIPLDHLLWFISNPHHRSIERLLLEYFQL